MDRLPRPGDLYRQDMGGIYQVITVASHAQTGEKLAIYQAMSGDYGIYAGPLGWFTEAGIYGSQQGEGQPRFERIEKEEKSEDSPRAVKTWDDKPQRPAFQRAVLNKGASAYVSAPEDYQPRAYPSDSPEGKPLSAPGNIVGSLQEAEGNPEDSQNTVPAWQGQAASHADAAGQEPPASPRPRVQSPAESRRALRLDAQEAGHDSYYHEKRRRQMEEREQRRGLFRKPERHESATEELRANPCLMKFLDAHTYEERFQVLNAIQDDITDRLIDDIAVVLDVVIPEGPLNDRFHQLRNIILTRQKYETSRLR